MTEPAPTTAVPGRSAAWWSVAAAVLMAVSIAGSFWVAPQDQEGEIQRLLFLHVPIAVISLLAFLVSCVAGIMFLRTRQGRWDDVVVIANGLGLLFVALTIISGSIWARGFWGTWWRWDDPRLVTYLIIALIYAAFFVLRSSAEDAQRARFSAVYAVVAFVSVPLSFWAVRSASSVVHPAALDSNGLQVDGEIAVWLLVGHIAVAAVFVALLKVELLQRRTQRTLTQLRMALEEHE